MPPFELRWKTYNHIQHFYGDLIWHLFWGIIIGILFIQAILNFDFWLLVINIIALVFFFHPGFYEPKLMDIRLTNEGVFIDKKFYSWEKFVAFEIFDNGFRKFVFLVPKGISLGIHFPIEEFFVSEEEVRKALKQILEEAKGSVPLFDKIYRALFI
jgi:hypothetical protein